jgi:DNA-binding NarL/FixJ family response regulator
VTTRPPRVLVVEDDGRVSQAVCAILSSGGFDVAHVADTAAGAAAAVRADPPDLVLVDLGLPDGDGVELIRSLRASAFGRPILVLTSATDPGRVVSALHGGADGYLFKEDLDASLASSLRHMTSGGVPLSPGAAQAVLSELRSRPGKEAPPAAAAPSLTPRERSVLELLSTGAGYADIARELGIEVNTIRSHVRSLYEKCGVQNRAEAVNLAWSLGLLRRA